MKFKRQKKAKSVLNFYKHNFSFREPHQILCDGTFCQQALKYKVQVKEQMPKYLLDAELQLLTTSCVLAELKSLGSEFYGALVVAKQLQWRKCGHKTPIGATKCLLHMVGSGNEHHYFIATQDLDMTIALCKIPGVPLVYLHQNTIVLEKPTENSQRTAKTQISTKVSLSEHEKSTITTMKVDQFGAPEVRKRRKRKGPREPNPLSQKKKAKTAPPEVETEGKKKRKRHRNKLMTKVRKELIEEKTEGSSTS